MWNPSNCEIWVLEAVPGSGKYGLKGRWRATPHAGMLILILILMLRTHSAVLAVGAVRLYTRLQRDAGVAQTRQRWAGACCCAGRLVAKKVGPVSASEPALLPLPTRYGGSFTDIKFGEGRNQPLYEHMRRPPARMVRPPDRTACWPLLGQPPAAPETRPFARGGPLGPEGWRVFAAWMPSRACCGALVLATVADYRCLDRPGA